MRRSFLLMVNSRAAGLFEQKSQAGKSDAVAAIIKSVRLDVHIRRYFSSRRIRKVRAVIRLQQGALVVPQRAVTELQGRYQVAVVGGDNKVRIRTVTVGDRVGIEWVITDGVKPGEKVVAEGVQ